MRTKGGRVHCTQSSCAAELYKDGEVTLGKAAEIADVVVDTD
ncbi:MAG: hypothetical protein ABSE39_00405 [Candidatus Bathyarchaeia archaeon]